MPIDGTHAAWPPGRRFPRPRTVRVTVGPKLVFADVQSDRTGWGTVAERCEAAVRALGPLIAADGSV